MNITGTWTLLSSVASRTWTDAVPISVKKVCVIIIYSTTVFVKTFYPDITPSGNVTTGGLFYGNNGRGSMFEWNATARKLYLWSVYIDGTDYNSSSTMKVYYI